MTFHEWIGLILVITSVFLVLGYRIKLRRERDRPTLRHALFASHLGHRVLFSGDASGLSSRLLRH